MTKKTEKAILETCLCEHDVKRYLEKADYTIVPISEWDEYQSQFDPECRLSVDDVREGTGRHYVTSYEGNEYIIESWS